MLGLIFLFFILILNEWLKFLERFFFFLFIEMVVVKMEFLIFERVLEVRMFGIVLFLIV